MAKKILIISSSPRRNSNSDSLCDEFMRGAKEAGNNVEKIRLADYKVNFCNGCDVCSTFGKPCPQKDDAALIISKMIDADIIVMASPVYFYTISAQIKTLIDRCCSNYTKINHKQFYYILSAAETNKKKIERSIDTFQGFLDCLNGATLKGVVYGLGVWHAGEIKGAPAMQEAFDMGKKIQ